jgi:lysophospholipase L1-like esterase
VCSYAADAQLCGQTYDDRIAHIHNTAQQLEGRKPRLVLTGSSSIRKWPQTDTVFSQYDVVNAGFGGSCFSDLWELRDTLIYALQPEVLVVYEGDNDLSDGVPSADIVAVANQLLEELSRELPETAVVVIAPKASLARLHLASKYLALNRELASVAMNHGAQWVDFWGVQHREDGTLRDDLFVADELHLNDEGYAIWVRELRRQLPWLDPRN